METLDSFDIAILQQLQADGRMTNAELAQRVGLSAAPCWRRVRELERNGFITGYRAVIDRHKIGLGVLAFVRLDAAQSSGPQVQKMEAAIRAVPDIVSCHYISGSGTFELQVVSPDLDSFSRFAREVLLHLPNVKTCTPAFRSARSRRPARCRSGTSRGARADGAARHDFVTRLPHSPRTIRALIRNQSTECPR